MMTSMEILEKSLAASEKTIAALILQTYGELNKEFKMVESRAQRSQAYQNFINEYCIEKCGAAAVAGSNSMMVKLNVGGKVHLTKRSIMRLEGDSINFLYLIISGRWNYLLPRDHNGVIFVDLDPAFITPIFDKLRFRSDSGTNEHMIPRVSIEKKAIFNSVVLYYRIVDMIQVDTGLSNESKIEWMNDPKNILLLHSFLPSDLIEMRLRFELLYRGSRDGMAAADFHRLCDGKNDTISVIKDSKGDVFGGFADKAWSMQSQWVKSEKSFLFSLKSSLGKEAVKFPVNAGNQNSLLHQPSYMCAFGNGDLQVVPSGYGHLSCSMNIGTSYQNPSTAHPQYYHTHRYQQNTQISEIEVYQVIQEGSKAPDRFNVIDCPINLTSFTKTPQSPHGAVPKPTKVSNMYTNQTDQLSLNLLHMAKVAQMAEEELLLELMWIEHLSVPMSKRNLSAGLLAEWQRICKESADVLPLTNGVAVTSCISETLKRVEESMARLGMKVGSKITKNSTGGIVTPNKADKAIDDVISFNAGGTIIAVLRSTLLRQAPSSTFAASYSDRWVQQPDEVDEYGNIYMVKENTMSLHLHYFSLSSCFPCLFCVFPSFIVKITS